MKLSNAQLKKMGFVQHNEANMPQKGAHLIVYHKAYGFTFGFYCGPDVHFVLPFVEGFNWASHWKYHCQRTGTLTLW